MYKTIDLKIKLFYTNGYIYINGKTIDSRFCRKQNKVGIQEKKNEILLEQKQVSDLDRLLILYLKVSVKS